MLWLLGLFVGFFVGRLVEVKDVLDCTVHVAFGRFQWIHCVKGVKEYLQLVPTLFIISSVAIMPASFL